MEWRLFADIAETAGAHTIEIEDVDAQTVDDALAALIEEHPALEEAVLDDGTLADHLTILKNGQNVAGDGDGLDTPVDTGDELALFPPISGG